MNYFNFAQNKIIVAVVAILIIAGSIVFRERISQFLTIDTVSQPPQNNPNQVSETPKENISDNQTTPDVALQLAKYSGRNPTEVRPVPEEVKLFSEDQKQQIYAKIEENGRAVIVNPDFFYGWIDLGLLKKTIGDFEGARDAWEYAGVIQPGNSLSFSNLGELYWRYLHVYPQSEANFKIAIKHKPDDWQNYISLAELYHYSYKEKYELAPQALLDGLKAMPNDESLMRRLAYLYEQREEWQKSLEWWNKILEKNPEDSEVMKRIEKVKGKISS